jgi:hypothetical protein
VLIRVYYTYPPNQKFCLKVTHFFGVPELRYVSYTFIFLSAYAKRQRVLDFSKPFFIYSWDSLRSLQLIPSKLNYSLCGSFEVMTKQFV